jgi:hypothetical protein
MAEEKWLDVGPVQDFLGRPVSQVRAGSTLVALVCRGGRKAHALAAEP